MCTIPCFGLGMNATASAQHATDGSSRETAVEADAVSMRRTASRSRSSSRSRGPCVGACTSPRPATVPPGLGAGRPPSAAAPSLGGCPMFPANNPWNQKVSTLAGALRLGDADREHHHRRPHEPAPRLRRAAARTASRSRSCPPTQPKVADPLHRVRRRERSRPVPDPGATRRSRAARRVTATATCSCCSRGRATSSSSDARSGTANHWDADVGVNWNLTSNTLRPLGMDVGRRGRTADPARPRPLRRGRGRTRSTTRCGSRSRGDAEGLHLPRDALRVVVDEPGVAADGPAVAAEGELLARALPRQSLVILQALEDVRDDRRRQRFLVVHHRRGRHTLERQRPQPAEDGARQAFEAVNTGPTHH